MPIKATLRTVDCNVYTVYDLYGQWNASNPSSVNAVVVSLELAFMTPVY